MGHPIFSWKVSRMMPSESRNQALGAPRFDRSSVFLIAVVGVGVLAGSVWALVADAWDLMALWPALARGAAVGLVSSGAVQLGLWMWRHVETGWTGIGDEVEEAS